MVVACQMQIVKLRARPVFRKHNVDRFWVKATIALPDGFSPAGKLVTVNIGGAQAAFTLNANGRRINGQGACKLFFHKRTDTWTVHIRRRKGDWRTPWDAIGLTNTDIPKPGTPVTITVVVLVGDEGFAADDVVTYRAKAGKYGIAR